MKSIKPGRGPSSMNAVGSLIAVIFGVFWLITAISMEAPVFMFAFGGLFIIMGIVNTVYHFKNATSKNRYSAFDITDEGEEIDPLNERFGNTYSKRSSENKDYSYCPHCGEKLEGSYKFCPHCGEALS